MAQGLNKQLDSATVNVPFLNVPYGGYLHNAVPPEDAELTRVGPGTPGGEWFRRFWQPVYVADQLGDLPKAIRILGEDLVIFRDRSGQIGLLELHCSHRGTSLEFGQLEKRGIRCCYHAWLYDVDGAILETPGEPADSTLKDRLCHGAYPTLEHMGLVFAYMGPLDKRPAFPFFDTYDVKPEELKGRLFTHSLSIWPCNWLQIRENAMDPAHISLLHRLPGNSFFGDIYEELGVYDYVETPIGLACIDTRRQGEFVWVRVSDFIPPNINQACDPAETIEQRGAFDRAPWTTWWNVPVDDTNTMHISFWYAHSHEDRSLDRGPAPNELQRSYEQRQRVPSDHDSQVSQRPIAVHALEHLAETDRGVIMLRRMVLQGIRAAGRGEDPLGVTREEGAVIPTYSHDRVLRIPRAPTLEEDRRLLLNTARQATIEYIQQLAPP
jgi:phenylpropionate dioxygenase-like ring-hydroxylating dioxygenase large terminal subunit